MIKNFENGRITRNSKSQNGRITGGQIYPKIAEDAFPLPRIDNLINDLSNIDTFLSIF